MCFTCNCLSKLLSNFKQLLVMNQIRAHVGLFYEITEVKSLLLRVSLRKNDRPCLRKGNATGIYQISQGLLTLHI
jgi:hypothetical protein